MVSGYRWHTTAYQRKEDPKFARLQPYIVYYNSANTMLADQCVYGVVFSEARRLALRCSDPEDWVKVMVIVLEHMFRAGYKWYPVVRQLEKFILKKPPHIYGIGCNRGTQLKQKIVSQLQRYDS